jgi:hypothetical protein
VTNRLYARSFARLIVSAYILKLGTNEMRRLVAFATLLFFLAPSVFGREKPLQPYTALVINKFTVAPDLARKADFPRGWEDVLQKTLLARLLSDGVFTEVLEASNDTMATSLPGQALTMDGEVMNFTKGNRAARVAVGYGAGAAKLKLVITFRDMKTGREVLRLEQTGRYVGFGNLTGGSADLARNEAARKVVDGLVKKIKAARQ